MMIVNGNKTDVDMIPAAFIEYETGRVRSLGYKAAECGEIERAKALSIVALTLESLLSNWIYTSGVEWRRIHEN